MLSFINSTRKSTQKHELNLLRALHKPPGTQENIDPDTI